MCKEQIFDYGNVTESYDTIDVEVCILFSATFWLSYHNDGVLSKWKTQLVILLSGESNMKYLLVDEMFNYPIKYNAHTVIE